MTEITAIRETILHLRLSNPEIDAIYNHTTSLSMNISSLSSSEPSDWALETGQHVEANYIQIYSVVTTKHFQTQISSPPGTVQTIIFFTGDKILLRNNSRTFYLTKRFSTITSADRLDKLNYKLLFKIKRLYLYPPLSTYIK